MDKFCRDFSVALLFSLIALLQNHKVNSFNCTHNNIDFSAISGLWISKSDGISDVNITYNINICGPLTPNGASSNGCKAGTSVCMIFDNGTALSAGNFDSEREEIAGDHNKDIGESWFAFAGDKCLTDPVYNLTTLINVKCGLTIGSPKFLHFSGCVSYFEWETDVACKGSRPKAEVQCYLYSCSDRYDLSPLARTKGGYLVSSDMDTDVYINVCRDINPVLTTAHCPEGAGACKVTSPGKSTSTSISLGKPTSNLQLGTDGRLTLKYISDGPNKPAGCTSPPSTTLVFICPKRGQSKDPRIVSDFNCEYIIEWETEYACPERTLKSSTCVLTKQDADIDIDLRPLTRQPGTDLYKVQYKDTSGSSNDEYDYFINVCGNLGIPCPDEANVGNISACQTKPSDDNFGIPMGSWDHMVLSYADGDLTLTYKGGKPCHHNNFQRQTVINFKCKKDANNGGIGSPVYDHEDECVYFFTWETKYACLDESIAGGCRVNQNGHRYDMSSLVKTHGDNWMALHDQDPGAEVENFFINVCHDIVQEGDATNCDPGSAICFRKGTSTRNLGRYEDSPFFNVNTNRTQIQYRNGDICTGTQRITSTITFLCMPGNEESAPVLIHKSHDGCFYDFEWSTATACELGHYTGNDCKVYGQGFTIDLSPLKKSDGSSYKVDSPTDPTHDYLLNVCGPVTGTKCDSLSTQHAGICQEQIADQDGDAFNAGQFSTSLHYFDGMVNLTYADGTPYNDDNHTPRKSEIVFLCDQEAGVGTPKFLIESSNHSYMFEWRTAYACPATPMECAIVDKTSGKEYDLSSLSTATGNWAVDGPDNTKYYINVCRTLNKVNVATGCSSFASVCRTKIENGKEKVDVPDMGELSSASLNVEADGRIKLRYEAPRTCLNGTEKVPYVTNIHFICQKDALSSSVGAPIKDGPCEYTFLWNTAAACPLNEDTDIVTEACTAKDPNNDYIFNLEPLMRSDTDGPYSVKVGDVTYKLNICGNISASICPLTRSGKPSSMCEIKSNGTKTPLAEAEYKLDFSETGKMTMAYDGVRLDNGQRKKVEINFVCNPSKDLGEPEFSRIEEDTYIFIFPTALACTPLATDCFVQDSAGFQYNLNSLSTTDYWMAVDARDANTKYYINVCRPVNNPPSQCLDGPIGGCQYTSNGGAYNMGYVQSKPVAENGTVSLHYRNGDICHKGKPNEAHRNTRINFFCAGTEGGPVFERETDTCEYIFNWRTPAACPLQSAEGDDCTVVEPRYHYQFDLRPLRNTSKDYKVSTTDGYMYYINVCGQLVEGGDGKCDKSTGVGACQTKPGTPFTPVIAGKGNSKLQYSGGELTLTYTDGKANCHQKYARQTLIKFTCDTSKDGSAGPIFIEEAFNCKYVFEWPTHRACPPFEVGACAVTGADGHNYDLFGLSKTNDNYEYTDTQTNKRYIINVCRSLIHQKGATCPYDAAACEVDLSKNDTQADKYTDIGEPNPNQISVENGKVTLSYTNGAPCGLGVYKTHITFLCDHDAKDTSPTGHFMVGDCDHHFLWSTSAACPLDTITTPKPTGGATSGDITCKVTSQTGTVFDLKRLHVVSGEAWNVMDKENHKYEFNVCGPLTTSQCTAGGSDMGVCQSKDGDTRTYNAGNAVNDLWWDDGVVVQTLTGGARCHDDKFQRSTQISFVCNDHHGIGRPVFQGETEDCTYYIAWFTDLVCDNQIKCTVDTPTSTIDLSLLSRHTDEMVASTFEDSTFYLSVCMPLTPIQGIMCPSGSGACQVKSANSNMQTSIGKPNSAPVYDPLTKKVTLLYTNGSVCDTDSTKKFTTRIIFSCLEGTGRSSPTFVAKENCEYLFNWPVSEVCDKPVTHAPPTRDRCGYTDSNTGQYYDFTLLTKSDTAFEVHNGDTKYWINVCKSLNKLTDGTDVPSSCGTAIVCRDSDGVSFGEPKNYEVVREGNFLKFTYGQGEKCGSTGAQIAESNIIFECDEKAGLGNPEFLAGFDCDIQILWKTDIVCPRIENPCRVVGPDRHLYDVSLLSKSTGSWNVTDTAGNIYYLGICSSVKDVPAGCGKDSGACIRPKDSTKSPVSLGSIKAQKSLYVDERSKNLVLEYGEGGTACSSSRSDNTAARTKINFICGTTLGAPVFVESNVNKDKCLFEFTWKTHLACKVQRENVTVKAGEVADPQSGIVINLKPIWNQTYMYKEELDSGNENVYHILLNGSSTKCKDGVVCMKNMNNPFQILGTFSSAQYFMDDDQLEARFSTNQICAGQHSLNNISTIIQFECSKQNNTPKLLHKFENCLYAFTWETTNACQAAAILTPAKPAGGSSDDGSGTSDGSSNANTSNKKSGGVSTGTVVGIVATFLGAIVLCILLVVFHGKERRDTCFSRVRGAFQRGGASGYSQLPTGGIEDIFGEEDEIITVQDASGTTDETVPIISTKPTSYHDDSDEDLLA